MIKKLPSQLHTLDIDNNALTELPVLSDSLAYLFCSNNQLKKLPNLPQKLVSLVCFENPLVGLPFLPPFLNVLMIDEKITCLPNQPKTLGEYHIKDRKGNVQMRNIVICASKE
jgi:Leucine-rich repeat (LRR) protein